MTRSALAEEEVPEGWDKWAIAAEQGFNTFATALGRDERWFDRFLAQHIAVAYYFLTVLMYLVSPRMAYNFSKCVEKHAFSTYDKFIESHGATKCSRNRGPVVGVSSVKFSMSCPPPESERLQLDTSAGRPEALRSRRDTVIGLLLGSTTLCFSQWLDAQEVLAEEEAKQEGIAAVQKQESVFDGLKALLDPNETTKSGKKLPKAYLKSARGVVTKLRDSFSGDSKNETQFRRNADSAKEAIRDYVSNWRGSKEVSSDESYQALEKALRVLGEFYSKQGPRAALPGDVRARVLESLQTADDNL
ncbi:hypothetical protein R1sor_009337 [Riccia sorocarpa]|uniref:Ubiquinol oxidase n=1 Tax=Riccia sorocarpa TaxID=122646 RepID=A0ABD3HYX6_9MARC